MYFLVIQFLENILPILVLDFQLEIPPEKEMDSKHKETYLSKNLIHIRSIKNDKGKVFFGYAQYA